MKRLISWIGCLWLVLGTTASADTEVVRLLLPQMTSKIGKQKPVVRKAGLGGSRFDDAEVVATAAELNSPIVIVLDFHHVWGERPECLLAELLPVVEDPRFRDRLQIFTVGPIGLGPTQVRGRAGTYSMLNLADLPGAKVDAQCGRPGSASNFAQSSHRHLESHQSGSNTRPGGTDSSAGQRPQSDDPNYARRACFRNLLRNSESCDIVPNHGP